MHCIMFLQNVSFFCGCDTFSGVNSGRDIKFCSKCGLSACNAFSGDCMMSSLVCLVGKVCNVS